jgi:hypothetical protein
MTDLRQELMTPSEAAKWFRRSRSWLRRQPQLLRVQGVGGQPLYHVCICRAYVLGRLCGLTGKPLRRLQIKALIAACGLVGLHRLATTAARPRGPSMSEVEKLVVAAPVDRAREAS